MATAIVNGRRITVPPVVSDGDLRQAAEIKPGRTLIRRARDGNYVVKPGEKVTVKDGDTFLDAPPRIKGGSNFGPSSLPRTPERG